MRMMNLRGNLLALLILTFAGCASFPKNKIEPVVTIPTVPAEQRAKVAVELKFFNGNPDQGKAESNLAATRKHQAAIGRVLEESAIFAGHTFDVNAGTDYPHQLKLVFFNDFSEASASVFGFMSGLTLGALPVAGSDNYTLKANFSRAEGMPVNLRVQDGVTNLIGLIFLPLAGNTPEEAQRQTLDNMVREILRQLVERGELVDINRPQAHPQEATP